MLTKFDKNTLFVPIILVIMTSSGIMITDSNISESKEIEVDNKVLLKLLIDADPFWVYEQSYPLGFDNDASAVILDSKDLFLISILVEANKIIVSTAMNGESILNLNLDLFPWNNLFDEIASRGLKVLLEELSLGHSEDVDMQQSSSISLNGCPWWDPVCVCDGGPLSPHPVPNWVASSVFLGTRGDVQHHLEINGYHETRDYARYYGGSGYDFTKVVSAHSCNWGPFRTQAYIYFDDFNRFLWSYRTQSPEPNPEILHYIWPKAWWGPYVQDWHT
ncbi:MAG: hypothetical protein ACXAD7_08015 [Candidatus Kariarchaeaceae archaeon]